MKYKLSGFPTVNKKIELPNIAELILHPFFIDAEVDFFRKNATDFQKWLLDQVPFRNDAETIVIDTWVNMLAPDSVGIFNRLGKYGNEEWHVDGFDYEKATFHVIQSECDSTTQFNEVGMELDLPEDIDWAYFNQYLNDNLDQLGIKPKQMPAGHFVTFDNTHAHSAVNPKCHEFRFYFRVREITTHLKSPVPIEERKQDFSFRSHGNEMLPNIRHMPDHVILCWTYPYNHGITKF